MTDKTILLKSKKFAIKIITFYKKIIEEKNDYIISKQLLRSGTSIGANVTEAEVSISKKEFLSKMYIAFKECAETKYWLDILKETNYISQNDYDELIKDCNELYRLLAAITKTTRDSIDDN